MLVDGKPYRTIWLNEDGRSVDIIDQTRFPHVFSVVTLKTMKAAAIAIRTMQVRGTPLIGATAAYGVALQMAQDASDDGFEQACRTLLATRPTAVNLRWALDEMRKLLINLPQARREERAYARAAEICDEDVEICAAIGRNGLELVRDIARGKAPGEPVNILTHCNAGWLETVDWGTAAAPIYMAHDAGIPVHVCVDEIRPRNQGAALTA